VINFHFFTSGILSRIPGVSPFRRKALRFLVFAVLYIQKSVGHINIDMTD